MRNFLAPLLSRTSFGDLIGRYLIPVNLDSLLFAVKKKLSLIICYPNMTCSVKTPRSYGRKPISYGRNSLSYGWKKLSYGLKTEGADAAILLPSRRSWRRRCLWRVAWYLCISHTALVELFQVYILSHLVPANII